MKHYSHRLLRVLTLFVGLWLPAVGTSAELGFNPRTYALTK
jgi:hypothetical protein